MSLLQQRRRAIAEGLLAQGLPPEEESVLAGLLRGASYLPYRLAGTPTDLGLLFTNALGLTTPNQQYAGSSDWIIDQASKYGLAAPRRGGLAESIGDIGGQILMPGASPAEMGAYAKALPFLLGTFKGINANLSPAETEMLQKAFELEQQGLGREAIRQATNPPGGSGGWFRAPWDQKWRMEIDDSKARWSEDLEKNRVKAASAISSWPLVSEKPLTEKDIFSHPDLYAAYPWLADIRIKGGAKALGEYGTDAQGRVIKFNTSAGLGQDEALRSTNLHELTHPIQEYEGMASGGSPDLFAGRYDLDRSRLEEVSRHLQRYENAASDEASRATDSMVKEAREWSKQHGDLFNDMPDSTLVKDFLLYTDPAYNRLYKEQAELKYGIRSKSPHEQYLRLAGEAEPRLVQARRDLTPQQRGLLDPIEQMDTMLKQEGITGGLDDLIVRYGDGPAMAIMQRLFAR